MICKICEEEFVPEDVKETDNICECCMVDEFDSLDLEDKIEVLLK
jgi:hypothetical protein